MPDEATPSNAPEITEAGWSKRLAVASTIPVFGLLAVGLLGGYVIYNQNKTTQDALTASQARAHTALQAETAILVMSKAEMQLMSASGPAEERAPPLSWPFRPLPLWTKAFSVCSRLCPAVPEWRNSHGC